MSTIRIGAIMMLTLIALPAHAQTFVTFACSDGTTISAAFFKGEKRMHMQLDGKALALPRRLSISGTRYAKGGVSFLVRGQDAMLKRPKRKAVACRIG
jgi:membrane-bound inhibitor of C-type lysozyme